MQGTSGRSARGVMAKHHEMSWKRPRSTPGLLFSLIPDTELFAEKHHRRSVAVLTRIRRLALPRLRLLTRLRARPQRPRPKSRPGTPVAEGNETRNPSDPND